MRKIFTLALISLVSLALHGQTSHPILAVGAPAPDFSLPGVDGKTHKLSDYTSSPVLAVVFTCDHCPIAQMYENRIEKLYQDYKDRGVAVIAIQGNDPKATTIDELDSSDIGDTLAEMKIRVQYKHIHYPYLYDGETQSVTQAYGPQATPHVFIFDKERHLRYQGRFDNSYRIEKVATSDARNAIDALLANKQVPVTHTAVFGCSTKWKEKEALRVASEQKLEGEPVSVNPVDAAGLKKLRANTGDNYTLVTFWATWCTSCIAEFSDLQDTYRMYSDRGFKLVTVSVNTPDEKPSVLRLLNKKHATSTNLMFSSEDTAGLQAAFDPKWQSAVPYSVLLGPNGKVLYSTLGSVDVLQLRRTLLAAMPSDYIGFNKYWAGQ
ncbi:peroxiredoxin [Silvibacterium bohemicum]|uniref:Peroxiredoxin n=1 Tax=Silvibacterium bohemicum TaxID=1577686 RepID=A0A841JQF6_9BACT|nr:redoxin domain-containing protein [Silvibacterium bohemicum]MBB6143593.1 peroxiredoxin [Silvibacterium bohemicum]